LPTKLTIFRVILIPAIVSFLCIPGRTTNLIAAILFFVAALSDFFDGLLARRYNCVTTIGKLLDPMTDKLLVLIVLIFLVELKRVEGWMASVILAREIIITTLRAIIAEKGEIIPARWSGKIKTLILHYPYFSVDMQKIGTYLLWVALFLSVISGIEYFKRFYRLALGSRRL
jgi:CDP-diacylglycerol--glycerol-3-phosphate 3-phosphatidyltransferase